MTIYSLQAEKVESTAKPVTPKAPRKRKPKNEAAPESNTPDEDSTPTPAAKKPRTEKQIAAAEKMRASRLAKKEMALKEAAAAEEALKTEIADKVKELADKKAAAKARREAKKAEKENEVKKVENEVKKNELPPKKQAFKHEPPTPATNDEEPPSWFTTFHQNVRQEIAQEKNEAISKKTVNNQAKALATQKWNDPPTRAKVQHEMDAHQTRMYNMMFSKQLQ